jgi:hypothetical protein
MQITLYGCTLSSTAPYLNHFSSNSTGLNGKHEMNHKSRTLKIINKALNDLKLQLYSSGYGLT